MIDMEKRHRLMVLEIMNRRLPGIPVQVFGSRSRGKAKTTADLDLLIMTNQALSSLDRALLKDDLSESDLPFRVDLVEAASADPVFLASIQTDLQAL